MPITEQAEKKLVAAREARDVQNKKIPFLINIKDGRLIPNVPMLAGRAAEAVDGKMIPARNPHPDYRPFTGDIKASQEERMKWLETMGGFASAKSQKRGVSLANVDAFDIGSATVDELITFAKDEYKVTLTAQGGRKALQDRVIALAKEAGVVVAGEDSLV